MEADWPTPGPATCRSEGCRKGSHCPRRWHGLPENECRKRTLASAPPALCLNDARVVRPQHGPIRVHRFVPWLEKQVLHVAESSRNVAEEFDRRFRVRLVAGQMPICANASNLVGTLSLTDDQIHFPFVAGANDALQLGQLALSVLHVAHWLNGQRRTDL